MKYNKLVRDNIVSNLEAKGIPVKWHKATPEEYSKALLKKLGEEAEELSEAVGSEAQMEEFADVLEVVDAIKKLFPDLWELILVKKSLKRLKKGGFENGVILEEA